VNVLFDETPIDVVNGEGGSFSFVMPAGDVTLDIVVEEIVTGINAVATTTKAQIFNAKGHSVFRGAPLSLQRLAAVCVESCHNQSQAMRVIVFPVLEVAP